MAEEQVQDTSSAPAATNGTAPATTTDAGPWYAKEDPDIRGYAELKGWKSVGEAVKSYRELERFRGAPADRLLMLPEKPDDKEGWSKIHERLGRPADPNGYDLPVPDGVKDDFVDFMKPVLFEAAVTKEGAKLLQAKLNEFAATHQQATEQALKEQLQIEEANLRKEWGGEYDRRVEMGRQAVRTFGIPAETLTKIEGMLGFTDLMRVFANVGERVVEHRFEGGDSASQASDFRISPERAKVEIDELMSKRDFRQSILDGDKAAKAKLDRLNEIAYGGG